MRITADFDRAALRSCAEVLAELKQLTSMSMIHAQQAAVHFEMALFSVRDRVGEDYALPDRAQKFMRDGARHWKQHVAAHGVSTPPEIERLLAIVSPAPAPERKGKPSNEAVATSYPCEKDLLDIVFPGPERTLAGVGLGSTAEDLRSLGFAEDGADQYSRVVEIVPPDAEWREQMEDATGRTRVEISVSFESGCVNCVSADVKSPSAALIEKIETVAKARWAREFGKPSRATPKCFAGHGARLSYSRIRTRGNADADMKGWSTIAVMLERDDG